MDFAKGCVERNNKMAMGQDEIEAWTAKSQDSTIVVIVFRITPCTLDCNDGLTQIITCLIGVYMLNLWGKASGKSYEVFPAFITLDGDRQEPHNNFGLDDLFTTITEHPGLSNHDVIVLTKTGLRYTEKPDDIGWIETIIGGIVDKRNKLDNSKAIKSCKLESLDSMFIEGGVKRFRKLEYDCKKNIDKLEGSKHNVAIDYDDEVSTEEKKYQEKTTALAKEYRVALELGDDTGVELRQLAKDGYKGSTNIPSYGLHTRLNNLRDELDKRGDKLRRIVSEEIERVQELGGKLPLHWENAKAISCTRRSPDIGWSAGIGESEEVPGMGGAQNLPCRQVSVNMAALKTMKNITLIFFSSMLRQFQGIHLSSKSGMQSYLYY